MRNLPNVLSFGRLFATIPLVILILLNQPVAYLIATVLFVAGSVTDTLDGRLARKYHIVSSLGIFLDLTADKVFVSAALIALVHVRLSSERIDILQHLVGGIDDPRIGFIRALRHDHLHEFVDYADVGLFEHSLDDRTQTFGSSRRANDRIA